MFRSLSIQVSPGMCRPFWSVKGHGSFSLTFSVNRNYSQAIIGLRSALSPGERRRRLLSWHMTLGLSLKIAFPNKLGRR